MITTVAGKVWVFGDSLALVFLAGEVVVDYALRIGWEGDSARLWVVAYSNDVPCYIASKRVLAEGGYEAGWGCSASRGNCASQPIHSSPSAQTSFFQMGTICLRRTMACS